MTSAEVNNPPPPRVLLALTGSVASIKALELFGAFESEGWSVKVVATESALHFVRTVLPTLTTAPAPPVPSVESSSSTTTVAATHSTSGIEDRFRNALHTDVDEWAWKGRGDSVLHIELRKWADVLVIAPLDANTLAKLANGLSDNLLTCIVRAWEFSPQATTPSRTTQPPTDDSNGSSKAKNSPAGGGKGRGCVTPSVQPGLPSVSKPIVLAPAMNTAMWDHPFTMKHLQTVIDVYGGGKVSLVGHGWDGHGVHGITRDGEKEVRTVVEPQCKLTIVSPVAKLLACRDVGVGAMAPTQTIVEAVKRALS